MFGSSLGNILIGGAVSKASQYLRDTFYKGSGLEKTFMNIGSSFGFDKFFDSPVSQGAYDVAKEAAPEVFQQLLNRGLGVNPATGQNMPTINVPEQDVFSSNAIQRAKNYASVPQGSRRIIDNALDHPVIENYAMKYTEARMPKMMVIDPTVKLSSLGALGKGQIKSLKS